MNRNVLVTGASRGIGLATAQRLLRNGWHVFAGVRRLSDADDLRRGSEDRCTPVQLDITDADDVAALDQVLPSRLDGIVNNAGIAVAAPLEAVQVDDLRHQLEVNVVGQVAVTQALLPALRASAGRIVFISSVSGRVSAPLMTPYTASKYAIEAIADGLRVELRPWGVRVVLIEPGSIDTDIWRGAESQFDETIGTMSEEHRRLYDKLITGSRKFIRSTAKRAAPVEKVVKAVEQAVTSSRPRTRYVVGADARGQLIMKGLLPDRAFDAMVARMVGG